MSNKIKIYNIIKTFNKYLQLYIFYNIPSQKYFLVLILIIYNKSFFLKIKVIITVTNIEIVITP